MSSVNKAIIIGHLGADPELKSTKSGLSIVEMRIATTEEWTGKDGKKNDQTEWHRVTVFGKTADACHTYLKKGSQAYVEGRIQTEQWEDKKGEKRYTTKIVAETVQFLGPAKKRDTRSEDDRNLPGPGYDPGPADESEF